MPPIATRERAFLTHIDSHVSVEEWQKEVAAQFVEAIKTLGSLADAEFCEIVIGDDDDTKLSVAVLRTLNKFWDEAQTPDFDPEMTVEHSGVRIYFEGESKFRFQTLRNMGGYQAAWGKNQNSESGAAHIERQGFFRNGDRADV